MVAARAEELKKKYEAKAKERMAEGGKKSAPGRPAEKGQDNCPDLSQNRTRDRLGEQFGVSGKLIDPCLSNSLRGRLTRRCRDGLFSSTLPDRRGREAM